LHVNVITVAQPTRPSSEGNMIQTTRNINKTFAALVDFIKCNTRRILRRVQPVTREQ